MTKRLNNNNKRKGKGISSSLLEPESELPKDQGERRFQALGTGDMRAGDQSGIPFLPICSEQGQRRRYNLASPGTLALGGKTPALSTLYSIIQSREMILVPSLPARCPAFPTPSSEPHTHVISMDWFSRSGRKGRRQKLDKVREGPATDGTPGVSLALGQPLRHPGPEMGRTRWEPSDYRPAPT